MVAYVMLPSIFLQGRSRRQVLPRRAVARTGVPSAVLSRNLASAAVALAVVIGLRTAAMSAIDSSIIPGSRASKPVKILRVRPNYRYELSSVTWGSLITQKILLSDKILFNSRQISTALEVWQVLVALPSKTVLDSRKILNLFIFH